MLFFEIILVQRKARILSQGEKSELIYIPTSGSPQGEPSSPIIFNIIVNGFVKAVKSQFLLPNETVHAQIFADDSAIVFSCKYYDDCPVRLNQILERTRISTQYWIHC